MFIIYNKTKCFQLIRAAESLLLLPPPSTRVVRPSGWLSGLPVTEQMARAANPSKRPRGDQFRFHSPSGITGIPEAAVRVFCLFSWFSGWRFVLCVVRIWEALKN